MSDETKRFENKWTFAVIGALSLIVFAGGSAWMNAIYDSVNHIVPEVASINTSLVDIEQTVKDVAAKQNAEAEKLEALENKQAEDEWALRNQDQQLQDLEGLNRPVPKRHHGHEGNE